MVSFTDPRSPIAVWNDPRSHPKPEDNAPRPGEVCGKVAGYFTPCKLQRGHEGQCQR